MTDSLFDADWLTQLASYHTLWVGFSGGLDSTVLLHSLACQPALVSKLSAVHVHHGLSPNADAWLEHCQTVCASLSIPLIVRFVEFDQRSNIEEHARKARYEAFAALMGENDGLLLAHHADDQAETLLLQILRGAGVDGLAAMPVVKPLGFGELVRPFLHHSRASLEAYAGLHQLNWIDDESNQDSAFSRNYLRNQVMPLLRARWPSVATSLARTATHCQQAKINLQALADLDCAELATDTLSMSALKIRDHARLANVLRIWLSNNQVRLPSTPTFNRIINEVILASKDAMPCVEWDGISVRRYQDTLYILKNAYHPLWANIGKELCTDNPSSALRAPSPHVWGEGNKEGSSLEETVSRAISMEWPQFPAPLLLGEGSLCATSVDKGLHVPAGSRVQVRFRAGGELFSWHGQTKTLKKLLQEWHVPPWQRDRVPLIYVDDELAAVVGFGVSDRFYEVNLSYTYHIELLL